MTNIYNLILLDESGSMSPNRQNAISSINETIQTIKAAQKEYPEQNHTVSIVTFSGNGTSGVRLRRRNDPADAVREFTQEDYCPNACTPLYDAMGLSISVLDKSVKPEDAVLVTIITDGMENSSTEFNSAMIKKMVEQQREKGWTFTYMGANQDAIEVSSELNIRNAINFEASEQGMAEMSKKYRKGFARKMARLAEHPFSLMDCEDFFDM